MYLVTAIGPNHTSPMEKKLYFLCGHTIFAIIIFAFLVSFGFWNHFFPSCSCLPCPLKYMVLCMSHLNICAAWHTVYYQAMSQESNFLKKTLFIVFDVVEDIAKFSS